MEKVKIYHDRKGNTLTVWFGDSKNEYICEETADEVILMKDKEGKVIGFEKLNYSENNADSEQPGFAVEALSA